MYRLQSTSKELFLQVACCRFLASSRNLGQVFFEGPCNNTCAVSSLFLWMATVAGGGPSPEGEETEVEDMVELEATPEEEGDDEVWLPPLLAWLLSLYRDIQKSWP